MLGQGDLTQLWLNFWQRHKIAVQLPQMPGDSLSSRVPNGVSERLLQITRVARVKGVEDERRVSQKRKELGGGLS